ncbi:tyrosinase-like [Lithobates pipiens]
MKKPMFITALLLLCVAAVDCMCPFPRECVEGVKDFPVPCCPFYNGTRCGSGEFRGDCIMVKASRTVPPPDIIDDERGYFPGFFFNWTCQCKPKFMGHNCGECAFGWIGDRCETPHPVYRKNMQDMNDTELQSYLAALHYCKTKIDPDCVILRTSDRFRERSMGFMDASFFDAASFAHYYATVPFISRGRVININNFAHGSSGFLTWHRLWLLHLERQMQKCTNNINFGLAYWKWETDPDCYPCDNKCLGANSLDGGIDKYSVFSEWRTICAVSYPNTVCLMDDCVCDRPRLTRSAGLSNLVKPTLADVYRCKNMTNIDVAPFDTTSAGFRNCLEGLHNRIHRYIGGTMSQVILSANDPFFSCHHANVDRIADEYYVEYGITPASYPTANTIYGHTATSCITAFYNCWRNRDMMRPGIYFGTVYV